MAEMKKVKVVLSADGASVDSSKSTVEAATIGTVVKQNIPFLADADTAIVGGDTTQNLVKTGMLVGAAVAGDHFDIKSKIGLGE